MGKKFDSELGKVFQDIRKSHEMSQQYVADRLHVSRSGLASWEQGRRGLSADDFFKLCEFYNVDPNEVAEKVKKYLYSK